MGPVVRTVLWASLDPLFPLLRLLGGSDARRRRPCHTLAMGPHHQVDSEAARPLVCQMRTTHSLTHWTRPMGAPVAREQALTKRHSSCVHPQAGPGCWIAFFLVQQQKRHQSKAGIKISRIVSGYLEQRSDWAWQ